MRILSHVVIVCAVLFAAKKDPQITQIVIFELNGFKIKTYVICGYWFILVFDA